MKKKKLSKLGKRKADSYSTFWEKKADAEWGRIVHLSNRCAMQDMDDCSGKLEAHHIIHRGIKCLRHKLENSILLCSHHHKFHTRLSPHMSPVGFAAWMQSNRPEQWTWAMENRWKIGKPNCEERYKELRKIK